VCRQSCIAAYHGCLLRLNPESALCNANECSEIDQPGSRGLW
jgi:hypothetical protein